MLSIKLDKFKDKTRQGARTHSIFQQSNRYRAAVKAVDGAGLLSPTSNFASIFIEQRPLRTHCPRCQNFKIFHRLGCYGFFFREFHHVASDNCLLFKEQVNMILNSFLCCTSCLFDNFLFRRHKSQKKIRRQKSFSPKICVLQASNLNFIDSLFSCRDNGGFLAELNSVLRIEAFTSLIMASMIHICLCLAINGGFDTNIPG